MFFEFTHPDHIVSPRMLHHPRPWTLKMPTAHAIPRCADLEPRLTHTRAIGERAIDWSRLAFLKSTDTAHALKINSLYEAQAALLILKAMAGEKRPYIDESSDACARGLIHTQYHCVTR